MSKTDPRYVPYYQELHPNSIVVATTSISAVLAQIDLGLECNMLELFNNDTTSTIYLMLTGDTTAAYVTSHGIPIYAESYYSIERRVRNFVLVAAAAGVDVRIIGHYNNTGS